MKKTLLEMVQEILSSIDGDEVNTYADTTESLQVAHILESCYWDIVSQASFPKMFTPFELSASGNTSLPNVMYLPENCLSLVWLRYDDRDTSLEENTFKKLHFVDMSEFLERMYSLDTEDTNVVSVDMSLANGDTFNIRCRNDRSPTYYTTIDDKTILFDSYDASVDTTLQSGKSLAYGEKKPSWTFADSFVPELPDKQFTILRNEAKSTAFAELKQSVNSNSERKARRGWITSQKTARKINNPRREIDRAPNYGR